MLAFHAPPAESDPAGDEKRKNRRKNEIPPSIPIPDLEDVSARYHVRRNGLRARRHVEENIPLRSEHHQDHRAPAEVSTYGQNPAKDNGVEHWGRKRGGKLNDRLQETGNTRV